MLHRARFLSGTTSIVLPHSSSTWFLLEVAILRDCSEVPLGETAFSLVLVLQYSLVFVFFS